MTVQDDVYMKMVDRRDDLAYRDLGGKNLSLLEQLELRVLNAIVRASLPKSTPLSKDVKDAVEEVKRLRRRS